MQSKDNQLCAPEFATEQNCNMIDGIPNNTALPVHPSVPVPEVKPLDKMNEPLRRKRSRKLER